MRKWLVRGALALLILIVLLIIAAWLALRASLPALEGEQPLTGLAAPATITRDAIGVVTIDAASEADAYRALGWVHAQERFFEMDLMRRTAAGELAELFGPMAVDVDREIRVHRMRGRLTGHLDAFAGHHADALRAYADGVNAGLDALDAKPWPYLLLGEQPEPWTVVDTPLVGIAMYFDLQDEQNADELALWQVWPHLPPALYALLTHDGSRWDAPMQGQARGPAQLPSAGEVDLRALPSPQPLSRARERGSELFAVGSNNFAVAGALTADGRAIVADDMHLGLRAPNVWFRVRLRYPDAGAPGGRVDVTGFSLAGIPGVVVGSNGHVAWGFTNSYGDWADWQRVPACGPQACAGEQVITERIDVAGDGPVELQVHETAWGPVLHREDDGSALALRWVAHLPGAIDLGLTDLARAGSLDEALAVRAGMPAQNLVVGDSNGRIAWKLLGPMPQRAPGCDPVGVSEPEDCPPWSLSFEGVPAIVDPASGRAWTANTRVVDGAALQAIGDGGYVLGARGLQIRDALFASDRFDEHDLLAIQLDDRALFLSRWWTLLRDEAAREPSPNLVALVEADDTWDGHAAIDSTSYRLVRAWRLAVLERIADGLLAPARAALGEDAEMPSLPQLEGVAWPLLQQRPAHLLPRTFDSWHALLEDAAADVRDELSEIGPLAERTWGERNTTAICHPLAGALPGTLANALCMPREPLPGDSHMPRVQSPAAGASQRMVVSPGNEANGIAHMPGGQSGHPLSPFWGAGHEAWAAGRPTPFLPGETRYTLRLVPADR
ncbi:MAG TPA: penicillin acylase family protein [Xanthomonadaceae bacterium]|nr:penicillin acylase family protein [Xanthomonadaceae bacterium]